MRDRTMAPRRDAEAAYQTVARELRAAILKDEYAGGVQLPTEADLAGRYQVSRQTVRRAFHDLVAEGMVVRIPGRGTFAAPREGKYLRQFGSIDDLMALSLDTVLRLISPLHRRIDLDSASRLRLDSDAVYTVSFMRLHDDVPFCVTTVHLPPDLGRALDSTAELTIAGTTSTVTVIGLLDAHLGQPIAEAEQSITAVPAPPAVAEQLACRPGEPMLRIDRLYYAPDGRPVELAVSYFLPQHYSYRVRLRRSLR